MIVGNQSPRFIDGQKLQLLNGFGRTDLTLQVRERRQMDQCRNLLCGRFRRRRHR